MNQAVEIPPRREAADLLDDFCQTIDLLVLDHEQARLRRPGGRERRDRGHRRLQGPGVTRAGEAGLLSHELMTSRSGAFAEVLRAIVEIRRGEVHVSLAQQRLKEHIQRDDAAVDAEIG